MHRAIGSLESVAADISRPPVVRGHPLAYRMTLLTVQSPYVSHSLSVRCSTPCGKTITTTIPCARFFLSIVGIQSLSYLPQQHWYRHIPDNHPHSHV